MLPRVALRHAIPLAGVLVIFFASVGLLGATATTRRTPAFEVRLAYIDDQQSLFTARPDGTERRRIVALAPSKLAAPPLQAEGRVYGWPTWAPDGARLAFVTVDVEAGDVPGVGAVHVATADGGAVRQIWASRQGGPIYFAWQPLGRQVALLAQMDNTLRLLVTSAADSEPWRPLASGQPLYLSWSPDGRSVAIHVGGDREANPAARLLLATWASPDPSARMEKLDLVPSGFRAPAWSADGRWLALSVRDDSGPAIVLRGRDGSLRRLTASGRVPAFAWSPAAPVLAVADADGEVVQFYSGLATFDMAQGVSRKITDNAVWAFFWSPDGRHLAYASPDFVKQVVDWHVVRADGQDDRVVAHLVPSREQIQLFAFFDQYAQSTAVWSPDGQSLVAAGWDAAQGPPNLAGPSSIFVIAADGRAAPRVFGPGSLAFWSPLAAPAWQP